MDKRSRPWSAVQSAVSQDFGPEFDRRDREIPRVRDDPRDWARPGVGEIESNVIDNAQPGAIVELHDGGGDRSETLAALPDIISTLRGRGYVFVTVTQLLGQQLIYR